MTSKIWWTVLGGLTFGIGVSVLMNAMTWIDIGAGIWACGIGVWIANETRS